MDTVPTWLFYIIAAVAGLELGGLATIFIHRWIDEKPILRPGSSTCPACDCKLGWLDTIPVISFFLLKGQCRHCEASIGPQYMLVELSCFAWSMAIAHHFGFGWLWAAYLVLGIMLVAGSFIDFETMLLPNRITLLGAAAALGTAFIPGGLGWQQAVLGAAAGGGFFWVVQHGYRLMRGEEGLGSGDVKLMLMVGAMVGLKGLPLTVLIASGTSAVGCAIIVFRAQKDRKHLRIPFGPFLSLGAMLYVLYGEALLLWWKG